MQRDSYFENSAHGYEQAMKSNKLWLLVKNWERARFCQHFNHAHTERVLDLGSGTGYYAELLTRLGLYVRAVDSSNGMVEILKRKGIPTSLCQIESLNLKEKFDLVIAMGSFEFMSDLSAGFKSVARHLTPEGEFYLMYPRGGLVGMIYKKMHQRWSCACYLKPKNDILNAAKESGLSLKACVSSGPINKLYIFQRKDGQ